MSTSHQTMNWSETAMAAFDVVDGEFVVVTADAADLQPYEPLSALLRRVRKAFGLEVAFIAEWAGGEPIVRSRDLLDECGPADHGPCVQTLYGMQLFDSMQAVAPAQAHFEAAPVITSDGLQYGTLCCRLPAGDGAGRGALQSVARLIANWFEEAGLSLSGLMPLQGHSMMGGLSGLSPLTSY